MGNGRCWFRLRMVWIGGTAVPSLFEFVLFVLKWDTAVADSGRESCGSGNGRPPLCKFGLFVLKMGYGRCWFRLRMVWMGGMAGLIVNGEWLMVNF